MARGWGSPPSPTGSCQAATPLADHSGDEDARGWVSPTLLPRRAGDPGPFRPHPARRLPARRRLPGPPPPPPPPPGPSRRLLPRPLGHRGDPEAPNPISGERRGLPARPLSCPRGDTATREPGPRAPRPAHTPIPAGDAGAQLVSSN
ncbi:hypothetical protein NN561_006831 [Cricetulus griseus]